MSTAHQQAIGAYQSQAIMTASKGHLILLAFDGLRKFIKLGAAAIEANNIQAAHENLMRAQAIVLELWGSLDTEKGGEIAHNLQRLYDYVYNRLIEANMKKDAALLQHLLEVVQPIRDGWAEAAKSVDKP